MWLYKNEEVNRIMPGKNYYKTVIKNGKRVQEQKYLILQLERGIGVI